MTEAVPAMVMIVTPTAAVAAIATAIAAVMAAGNSDDGAQTTISNVRWQRIKRRWC